MTDQPARDYTQRVLVPYRLLNGQIIQVDDSAAKGADVIDFTQADHTIVPAYRLAALPLPSVALCYDAASNWITDHATAHIHALSQTGFERLHRARRYLDSMTAQALQS